jgi:membrane protein implicated in regulation of membrane protease activity
MVEIKTKPNGSLAQELRYVLRKTIYLCALVFASVVLTFIILLGVVILAWLTRFISSTSAFFINLLLSFIDYESIAIFGISFISLVIHTPKALSRMETNESGRDEDK